MAQKNGGQADDNPPKPKACQCPREGPPGKAMVFAAQ